MKIKSFKEFINERKINENIESIDFNSIADQISIGETSGDTPCQWELEVSLRDWTNIDDEDIDYICDQIREGITNSSDPIDWTLDLSCDDYIEEEEEELTRKDIANQLDMDESEFEDSSDLGDMADRFTTYKAEYDDAYDIGTDLFDAFKMSDKGKYLSSVFTDTISPEMNYNRLEKIYKDVIDFYPEFEEEYGYIEEFNTDVFNNALKDIIKEFLKKGGLTESKKIKKEV